MDGSHHCRAQEESPNQNLGRLLEKVSMAGLGLSAASLKQADMCITKPQFYNLQSVLRNAMTTIFKIGQNYTLGNATCTRTPAHVFRPLHPVEENWCIDLARNYTKGHFLHHLLQDLGGVSSFLPRPRALPPPEPG